MYKLILIDDEARARRLLKKIIDWNKLGFKVVADFSNAADAISYIQKNAADVILSDIIMNEMSGIELAEYIYNNYPKIKVVLISAHKDFKYANDAFHYDVENYLLKPIKPADFEKTFMTLKDKLDYEKNSLDIIASFTREILQNLCNGVYASDPSFLNILRKMKIDIADSDKCATFSVNTGKNLTNTESILSENIYQNLSAVTNSSNINAYFVSETENKATYFLFSRTADKNEFLRFSHKICDNISSYYKKNCRMSDFMFYGSISSFRNGFTHREENEARLEELKKNLISATASQNVIEINYIINNIYDILSDSPVSELKKYTNELMSKTIEHLSDIIENTSAVTHINEYTDKLNKCESKQEFRYMAHNFFENLSGELSKNSMLYQKSNILKMRDYIAEHCTEDISLNKIAEMACLTPTWFSKLFKDVVGQTYIDFVISCKMNIAKDLLINTNIKVNEIGLKIGYENPGSFSRLFKSNCGMSPSEFKNKYAKRSRE